MVLQLNPQQTETLRHFPESGMGFQLVDVILRGGRSIAKAMVFNGTEMHTPNGISFEPTDIVRIEPHHHAEPANGG